MKKLLIVAGFVMILIFMICVGAKPNYISINNCQTLNVTNGYYILKEDIKTSVYSCFAVTANGTTLDLNGYSVIYIDDDSDATAVSIYQIKNFTLKNGKIINFPEGVESYNGNGNSQIINVSFSNHEEFAIYFRLESNSLIKGCTFMNSSIGEGRSALNIEDSFNVSILDSTFLNNYGGILIEDGGGNIIKNNSIINSGNSAGIEIDASPNTLIRDIIFKDNHFDFLLKSSDYVNHSDCNQSISPLTGSDGLPILIYTSRVNVSNLQVSEIILCNADGSYLNNITLSSRGKSLNGFFVTWTDNSYFSDIFLNNTFESFLLDRSHNNTLNKLNLTNNEKEGLRIYQSDNNVISEAIVVNNGDRGIEFGTSGNNTLRNSRIEDNSGVGVYLPRHSSNNSIYNNFFRNLINAPLPHRNDGVLYENYWSTSELIEGPNIVGGPYIGGNYWANIDGSGHSEVCLDLDENGICEWLYAVNQVNIDYFPLHL